MLKHAILNHPEQDPLEIKFGMKVVRFCKTSFERQLLESVVIQKERKTHNILNSRAEYNRCSLPRLTTQLGDKDFKKYEKEVEDEKNEDDIVEKKIREMRKEQNKKRLHPTKETGTAMKRRKVNDNEYVSIREIWGRPEKKIPVKIKNQEHEKNITPPSKKRKSEKSTETEESEDWEKLSRFKKIEKLKEKYKKREMETTNQTNNINNTNNTTPDNKQDQWTKWREQENINKQEMREEAEEYADMTLTEENPENEQDIADLADWLEEQERKAHHTQENPTSWDEQDEVSEQELVQIAEQVEKDRKVSQPKLNSPSNETINTRRKPEKQLTLEDFLFKKQAVPEAQRPETPERTEKPTPKVQKSTPKLPRQEKRPKLSTSMKPDSEKKKKKENSKKRIKQEQEKKTIKQLQTFWNKFAESHSSTSNSTSTSQEGFDTTSVHQGNQVSRPGASRVTPLRIGQTNKQNSSANNLPVIADLQLKSESLVKTRSQPRD